MRPPSATMHHVFYMFSNGAHIENTELDLLSKILSLYVIVLLTNVCPSYKATVMQVIIDIIKLVIRFKKLHFKTSNKVIFTCKTSFSSKPRTL